MGHVSNKPDQQRHFMPLSMPVRNISYLRGMNERRRLLLRTRLPPH